MVNRSRKTILEETNSRADSEEAEFTEDIKKKKERKKMQLKKHGKQCFKK